MATPGAAGVAALMYQANPDLDPFAIRNIHARNFSLPSLPLYGCK